MQQSDSSLSPKNLQIEQEQELAYRVFVRVVSAVIAGISILSLVCTYVFLIEFFYFDCFDTPGRLDRSGSVGPKKKCNEHQCIDHNKRFHQKLR